MASWTIAVLTFYSFVTHAAAESTIDKKALKTTLISGLGTKAKAFLTQAQIDSIDRDLTIKHSLPRMLMNSAMPSPFNETCGQSVIQCHALELDIKPGMEVTTAMVRNMAMDSKENYATMVAPTYTWTVTEGKKYSFIMADALSTSYMWTMGMMKDMDQVFHYAVFNIDGNDMATGKATGPYAAPGNPEFSSGNVYVNMVFEHDADVDADAAIAAVKAMPFNLNGADWKTVKQPSSLANAGLGSAKLVALNWYKAKGVLYSRQVLEHRGEPYASMVANKPCKNYKGQEKPYGFWAQCYGQGDTKLDGATYTAPMTATSAEGSKASSDDPTSGASSSNSTNSTAPAPGTTKAKATADGATLRHGSLMFRSGFAALTLITFSLL